MRPGVLAAGINSGGAVADPLFSVGSRATGERMFTVHDSGGDVLFGYDLSSSTYNAVNSLTDDYTSLVAIGSMNRDASQFESHMPCMVVTTGVSSSYQVQMERGELTNVNIGCWVMLAGEV